jgi:hypothetical protein
MIFGIKRTIAMANPVIAPVPGIAPVFPVAASAAPARAAVPSVPWHVWCSVIAVTSVMIGGYWDISWHMSIGRDTFWTPAHMAIYFCGVLAGISCGYLILSSSFGHNHAVREASVRMWGFHAPLGAFISAWGGIAMITSAPFDNWWHSAYGLDVKIFSPPHLVLDTGILAVQVGSLVLIGGAMNRAQGALRRKLECLFLYIGAMMLTLGLVVVWEYTYRVHLHNARCYRAVCVVAPVVLVGVARASGRRWASTILAAIYSVYLMVMLWIFPLFPAQPKLGPIYRPITHFVPLEFPLLLIVPAFVLDVLWARMANWKTKWSQAVVAGSAFLATFVAAEWPFANFLMSPASRNWFFGTHYFTYFEKPNSYAVRNLFYTPERAPADFWLGMALALVIAVMSTRVGNAWGEWVRGIRR